MSSVPESSPSVWRNPIAIFLGTVLVGAIGSGLWDVIIKPFGNYVWAIAFFIVTFGSDAIRDVTFADAALDPTHSSSLAVFANSTAAIAGLFLGLISVLAKLERWIKAPPISSSEQTQTTTAQEAGILASSKLFLGVLIGLTDKFFAKPLVTRIFTGILIGVLVFQVFITTESVRVWRYFHADMRKCGPYLSQIEEKKLFAEFASIRSRSDFLKIVEHLQVYSKREGFQLHSERL